MCCIAELPQVRPLRLHDGSVLPFIGNSTIQIEFRKLLSEVSDNLLLILNIYNTKMLRL